MTENKVQCIAILKVANGYITIPIKMTEAGSMDITPPFKVDQMCVFHDFLVLMKFVEACL